MNKKLLSAFLLSGFLTSSFAMSNEPSFTLLPNIKTQHLLSTDATQALTIENNIIHLVKRALNIRPGSPYRSVRIRTIYNDHNHVEALIVYLLSAQNKSLNLLRINLNDDFSIAKIINPYELQQADLAQSPHAKHAQPTCPNKTVQFVIGNVFYGEKSVEKEVQKVYLLAMQLGYSPILLDVNDPNGPQPTLNAYENWLSCPNVKGFYNESHGWQQGIVLADDDFTYLNVSHDLIKKLKSDVILFDSCLTFYDPLLATMTHKNEGDSQQYIAGSISLPFGPSERTASCIWTKALKRAALDADMIADCARQYDLQLDGFMITGNGDNHVRKAGN